MTTTRTLAHVDTLLSLARTMPRDAAGFAGENTLSRPGSARWEAFTTFILDYCERVCVVCGENAATVLGHIVPAGKNRRGYNAGNIAGMCVACNSSECIGDNDMTEAIPFFANPLGIPTAYPSFGSARKMTDYSAHRARLVAKGILPA